MRIIISSLFILAFAFQGMAQEMTSSPQSTVTTTKFEVQGVCGMCKERIENAAYIKGVKKATWDKNSMMLTVTYRPDKTEKDKIERAIAKVGHDTPNHKATEDQYNGISKCCRYRGGEVKTH